MKGYTDNSLLLREKFLASAGVTTDSRRVQPGQLFFALRGERFDGNDYAEQVVASGALCAVVERGSRVSEKVYSGELDPDVFIVVEDCLKAMQNLARWHRLRFDIPVIALTGTNGKTTTKELVNAVLSTRYRTVATCGNLNNHIGVPLTLFRINADTQMAVVEMGASAPGEIETLVNIACPTHGLITNVGKAHLHGFGSFEGVCRTKGELYDFLWKSGGTAFYNVDNPHLREMVAARFGMVTVKYGRQLEGWKVSRATARRPFLSARNGWKRFSTQLVGEYNIDNALAALSIGARFGVPFAAAVRALKAYTPSNSRSQMKVTARNVLILDTYNANPTSMRTSVENFARTDFPHKVLILGDMLELGSESSAEHSAIVSLVRGIPAEKVFLVGKEFGGCAEEVDIAAGNINIISSGFVPSGSGEQMVSASGNHISFFSSAPELSEYLERTPLEGKTVLVKGSNGMHLAELERVL